MNCRIAWPMKKVVLNTYMYEKMVLAAIGLAAGVGFDAICAFVFFRTDDYFCFLDRSGLRIRAES